MRRVALKLESICGEILERPSGPPLQLAQGSDTSEVEVVEESRAHARTVAPDHCGSRALYSSMERGFEPHLST
jgi:hypothetical protein